MKKLNILLCQSFRKEKTTAALQKSLLYLTQSLSARLSLFIHIDDVEHQTEQEDRCLAFKKEYQKIGGDVDEIHLAHGSLHQEFNHVLEKNSIDLIVMSNPGKSSSFIGEVIRENKLPLLLLKGDGDFKGLACAYDMTKACDSALSLALLFSRAMNQDLHVNYLCPEEADSFVYPEKEQKATSRQGIYGNQRQAYLRRQTTLLSTAVHKFPTAGLNLKTQAFNSFSSLSTFWYDEGVNLIFLGVNEWSLWKSLTQGSLSKKMIENGDRNLFFVPSK